MLQKLGLLALFLSIILSSSCTDDLDRFPENDETEDKVFSNFEGYTGAIAKVYGGLTLSGNEGPTGKPDLPGTSSSDEGAATSFVRLFFNLQTLPTEEAICSWLQDTGISELNNINFSASNPMVQGIFYRCGINISYANNFIANASDETLASKGFSDTEIRTIKNYRAEARFLRAYNYWALLDLFRNPSFYLEDHKVGQLPQQTNANDLFAFIEKELLEISDLNTGDLVDARQNEYGRADKGAAWALLARLYLNAESYTGTARYTDAVKYSQMVISAGYSLKSSYEELFLADNNLNNNEVILTINYDGEKTRSYAGTTFLIASSYNGNTQSTYDVNYGLPGGGWGGNRTRLQFSEKFDNADKRRLLVGDEPSVTDLTNFETGLATYKWRNVTSKGVNGSNSTFADTDFPLFRLAEMYLTYAEAVLRGGSGGSQAQALTYMNNIRERAFGDTKHNYSSISQVSLDEILDERARELYWECQRRTDLVRYGYFTSSSYVWEWKGGVQNGRGVSSYMSVYPLPAAGLSANKNLVQNNGYK